MKVYILLTGSYGDYVTEKVFTDKALADRWVQALRDPKNPDGVLLDEVETCDDEPDVHEVLSLTWYKAGNHIDEVVLRVQGSSKPRTRSLDIPGERGPNLVGASGENFDEVRATFAELVTEARTKWKIH